jgi:glycosyltransferase involved in cell wall biosynthesis
MNMNSEHATLNKKVPKELISIVVPLYNEVDNVQELHTEILNTCKGLSKYDFEIIFIDDGSTDGTDTACSKLSPLTTITLRKNFGQTAAFDAGFKAATGNYIVTMDGDLQNNPADIDRLLCTLKEEKSDVVSGWRKKRKDTLMKQFFREEQIFSEKCYYKIQSKIVDAP